VVGIEDVISQPSPPAECIASPNLGKPRDSGSYVVAVLFSCRIIGEIFRKEGAGADKAHVAFEYVYKLK
jgi:hypothetical protein